jgi:hypothetical protein
MRGGNAGSVQNLRSSAWRAFRSTAPRSRIHVGACNGEHALSIQNAEHARPLSNHDKGRLTDHLERFQERRLRRHRLQSFERDDNLSDRELRPKARSRARGRARE